MNNEDIEIINTHLKRLARFINDVRPADFARLEDYLKTSHKAVKDARIRAYPLP